MSSGKRKIITATAVINLILIISIVFNIFQFDRHNHYLGQMRVNNQQDMEVITYRAENLANRLDQFINSIDDGEYDIHTPWRVAFSESISIKSFLARLNPYYMGDLKEDWKDLQFILSRVETPLSVYNFKFLEQGSYSLTSEEREELKAVATVYRSISEGIERDPNSRAIKVDSELIDSLTEPMMLIDPNYSIFLDFRENRER